MLNSRSGPVGAELLQAAGGIRFGLSRDVVVVKSGLVASSNASGVEILGHDDRETWW